jgi:hypothetical protein
MRLTNKQRDAIARFEAAHDAALEAGRLYHKNNLELLLVEVHWHANRVYDQREHEVNAFIAGFISARRSRDEYLREQKSPEATV